MVVKIHAAGLDSEGSGNDHWGENTHTISRKILQEPGHTGQNRGAFDLSTKQLPPIEKRGKPKSISRLLTGQRNIIAMQQLAQWL